MSVIGASIRRSSFIRLLVICAGGLAALSILGLVRDLYQLHGQLEIDGSPDGLQVGALVLYSFLVVAYYSFRVFILGSFYQFGQRWPIVRCAFIGGLTLSIVAELYWLSMVWDMLTRSQTVCGQEFGCGLGWLAALIAWLVALALLIAGLLAGFVIGWLGGQFGKMPPASVDVCPTVTAFDIETFNKQLDVATGLAKRLHIDLMDGVFAPSKSPTLDEIGLPSGKTYDIHLMYQRPLEQLDALVALKPSMVIIHAEADVDHSKMAAKLHEHGIKIGLALLADTVVESTGSVLKDFDQALIFSGHLGYHGGITDLALLDKVSQVRAINPDIEIAWDGGIKDQNARALAEGGVQVLNVGGFIQKSTDPAAAYAQIDAALAG